MSERARSARRSWGLAALLLLVLVVLSACAPGTNTQQGMAGPEGGPAGFWLGFWQGFIAPITFIISLFVDTVNVYEVHNNGNWYNFGFVLGAGILFGGGFAGSRRRRR